MWRAEPSAYHRFIGVSVSIAARAVWVSLSPEMPLASRAGVLSAETCKSGCKYVFDTHIL